MKFRGNSAFPTFGSGRGLAAVEFSVPAWAASRLRRARAGLPMVLSRASAAFAWCREAAELLRQLPSADDNLFRDVGLNRSLIERSEYRLERRTP